MNYAAHASVLFGRNAISSESVRTLVASFGPEALEEEVAFSLKRGTSSLSSSTPRRAKCGTSPDSSGASPLSPVPTPAAPVTPEPPTDNSYSTPITFHTSTASTKSGGETPRR